MKRASLPLELAVAIALAAAARALVRAVPGAPVAAVTLGLAMLGASLARRVAPGRLERLRYSGPLTAGLILLGVQLVPGELGAVGWSAPLWILGYQASVIGLIALVPRSRRLGGRARGLLAMGLSGAGISAVIASADSDPKAPADIPPLVLSGVLTTGAIGFVVFPLVADALRLDAAQVAAWAGIAMPSTTEAVLVGATHSEGAMRLTAAWRLLVNLLQFVPIALYLAAYGPRREDMGSSPAVRGLEIGLTALFGLPLFVWGLALVSGLSLASVFDSSERAALAQITGWALLTSLAGIGWNTRPSTVFRHGIRSVGALILLWAASSAALLCAIRVAR